MMQIWPGTRRQYSSSIRRKAEIDPGDIASGRRRRNHLMAMVKAKAIVVKTPPPIAVELGLLETSGCTSVTRKLCIERVSQY